VLDAGLDGKLEDADAPVGFSFDAEGEGVGVYEG
jgi:hypothetical protein